jgi:hypothetical protein
MIVMLETEIKRGYLPSQVRRNLGNARNGNCEALYEAVIILIAMLHTMRVLLILTPPIPFHIITIDIIVGRT